MVMAPQTKTKLKILTKPNQKVFNQTQSKEIYQRKLNQIKPNQNSRRFRWYDEPEHPPSRAKSAEPEKVKRRAGQTKCNPGRKLYVKKHGRTATIVNLLPRPTYRSTNLTLPRNTITTTAQLSRNLRVVGLSSNNISHLPAGLIGLSVRPACRLLDRNTRHQSQHSNEHHSNTLNFVCLSIFDYHIFC